MSALLAVLRFTENGVGHAAVKSWLICLSTPGPAMVVIGYRNCPNYRSVNKIYAMFII